MVFGFFRRTNDVETERLWNNDAHPTYETTRARFRIHKQIRDGKVPVLKPVVKVIDDPLYIATYKKGTTELYERQDINSPSATRARSTSRGARDEVEEGEVIVSDTELRPQRRRRRNRKKRKRNNSEN